MSRKYELKQRAEQQVETRRRIVEAAIELHRTVGPAKTTVSAIAARAGVERKTFYRHFPEPGAIFAACSSHFRALNPPPDPERWRTITDPSARISRGLEDCYRYYRRHERLIENALRDRELGLPVGEGFLLHRAAAKRVLADGLTTSARRHAMTAVTLDLFLDFHSWKTLTRDGLSDRRAAKLAASLIATTLT